jgi:hypothetical protein
MNAATRSNGPVSLDANQATITTATVTIRTLRVNNKQLTQATFRQLPVRKLIDMQGPELKGTIWGWVNFTPPGCRDRDTQFIVQIGEELCRCPFRHSRAGTHPTRPGKVDFFDGDSDMNYQFSIDREDAEAYAKRWNELMARVEGPQLFIAV